MHRDYNLGKDLEDNDTPSHAPTPKGESLRIHECESGSPSGVRGAARMNVIAKELDLK